MILFGGGPDHVNRRILKAMTSGFPLSSGFRTRISGADATVHHPSKKEPEYPILMFRYTYVYICIYKYMCVIYCLPCVIYYTVYITRDIPH